MNRKRIGFLIFIIVAAFSIRFYKLGELPSILNRDEAALAYNALLLHEVGLDEWGKAWPLALESFGDFKLLGYPLALVFLFKFLPLTDLVVRLPSLLAGSLLPVIAFFLATPLLFSSEGKKRSALLYNFLIALLVAVSPVFFFYSRIAYEANLGLFFFVTGLLLILLKTRKRILLDLIAMVFFIAAVLTYNTPLLMLPFLVPLVIFDRGLKAWKTWLLPVLGLGVIFSVVFIELLPLTSQKSGITIFNDESTWRESIIYREQFSGIWQRILGNSYLFYLQIILKNFFLSFGPKFLVTNGGSHPWHSLPNWGHFYWSIYALSIGGILTSLFSVLKNIKKLTKLIVKQKSDLILLYLMGVGLVSSIITVDSPHTTRSLFFVLILILFAVNFLFKIVVFINRKFKISEKNIMAIFLIILSLETASYAYQYFKNYPQNQPDNLKIGFDKVILEVEEKHPDQMVAVIDPEGFHYILTAWYLKLDPKTFLENNVRQLPDKIGFRYGEKVTHYHFIAHPNDRSEEEKVMIDYQAGQWEVETF